MECTLDEGGSLSDYTSTSNRFFLPCRPFNEYSRLLWNPQISFDQVIVSCDLGCIFDDIPSFSSEQKAADHLNTRELSIKNADSKLSIRSDRALRLSCRNLRTILQIRLDADVGER
jgi:hypothetical protein